MKVIFAITTSEGAENINDALKQEGFRVTMMSSMGGFLRRRNATLMIGVRDDEVERAIDIIKANAPPPDSGVTRFFGLVRQEPATTSVTVFVINMSRYERFQP